jgi:molybdopterin-guanine dinucleotide biosynthesis protein A
VILKGDKSRPAAEKHSKHTALIRTQLGNFGRNEWAFLGAPCDDIKSLAETIIAGLSPNANIAYADAQHRGEPNETFARLAAGAILEYTEKGGQSQLSYNQTVNNFHNRPQFNNSDMILINGNHHQGKRQVVIIDSRKKASLQKRVEQLTDVRLFLLADGETEVFDFVKNAVPNWQLLPVYRTSDTGRIIEFFRTELSQSQPELCGLVLAGGKSARMGQDKSAINWHGKDQRYYLAGQLKKYTDKVYISCRGDQQQDIDPAYQALPDTFINLGPFGAILSAFREQPDKAWLVVACDLPLLNQQTLDFLVAHRDPSSIATAFQSSYNDFPEPLITIWEPKSYQVLLSFLAQGYSCPRKVLINSDVKVIQPPNPDALTNVNTPEERDRVERLLQQKDISV